MMIMLIEILYAFSSHVWAMSDHTNLLKQIPQKQQQEKR